MNLYAQSEDGNKRNGIWDYLIAIFVLLAGYPVYFLVKFLKKFQTTRNFLTKFMHSLQIIFQVIPENTCRRRSTLYSGVVLTHADNISKLNFEVVRRRGDGKRVFEISRFEKTKTKSNDDPLSSSILSDESDSLQKEKSEIVEEPESAL